MFEDLPNVVLHEILHKLPVESLMQLRCVSKSFNSLITSRAFIEFSSTPSKPDPNKLIVRYLVEGNVERYRLIVEDNDNNDSSSSEQIQDFEFPLTSRWGHFKLVGSANGLFCLYRADKFMLWTPCIRKLITRPTHHLYTCLGLGFGFDSRDDDYKVVEIADIAKDSPVAVYSVREGSWRVARGGVSCPARIIHSFLHPEPASLNGALHFVAEDWCGAQSLVVLSFDLGDEVFRVISLPNDNFRSGANIGISVSNGLLSLLSYEYQDRRSQCYSVWVMKEYDVVDSWIKKFTIDLNMLGWKVLGFFKNDHVLVQKVESCGSKLLSYDPESEQVKNLGFYRSTRYSYADNYVRNLNFLTNQMM